MAQISAALASVAFAPPSMTSVRLNNVSCKTFFGCGVRHVQRFNNFASPQKVPIAGFPKLPKLRALKNSRATDVAEKVNVDSTAPPPKPSQGAVSKRTGFSAWTEPLAGILQHYNVDLNVGLKPDAVERQRLQFGWNELEKGEAKPFWRLVAEQFEDTSVQILLAAAGVSFLLALSDLNKNEVEAFTEPLVILSIIILNAVIGVWQERKAESTLSSLKEMQAESSRVLRGTEEFFDIPSRDLVPGDIVELRAGDKVSADMRIAVLKSGTIRLQ